MRTEFAFYQHTKNAEEEEAKAEERLRNRSVIGLLDGIGVVFLFSKGSLAWASEVDEMQKTKSRNFGVKMGTTEERNTPKKRYRDKGYDSASNAKHENGLVVLPAKGAGKRRHSDSAGPKKGARKPHRDVKVRTNWSASRSRDARDIREVPSEAMSSYATSVRNSKEFRVRKKKAPKRTVSNHSKEASLHPLMGSEDEGVPIHPEGVATASMNLGLWGEPLEKPDTSKMPVSERSPEQWRIPNEKESELEPLCTQRTTGPAPDE